jgi:hypothetical protein
MTDLNLEDALIKALKSVSDLSASELSSIIKVPKTELNSVLYRGKGRIFKSVGDRPPLWSLIDLKSESSQNKHLSRKIAGNIHIDFTGGDWELEIGMEDTSRNDPIARVEKMGKRKRLIIVSSQVVSSNEQDFLREQELLPDSAIAIASAILAWEIFHEMEDVDFDSFHFEKAISDIFLSISAHAME